MWGKRFIQTVLLNLHRRSGARGRFLRKRHIFAQVGERVFFQPRIIPLYPELIRLHSNIMIASNVRLITHDAIYVVLNGCRNGKKYQEQVGCIEIMDNVFIGFNTVVLPNVRIGQNVIVGADSVVTKDLEANGVYVGCPAKRISSFDEYCEKAAQPSNGRYPYPTVKRNTKIAIDEIERAWTFFNQEREKR